MKNLGEMTLQEKLAHPELREKALQRASREALLKHARAGNPIAIWRDGKVVWLSPEETFALLREQEKSSTSEKS